jgi:hypothetical protein
VSERRSNGAEQYDVICMSIRFQVQLFLYSLSREMARLSNVHLKTTSSTDAFPVMCIDGVTETPVRDNMGNHSSPMTAVSHLMTLDDVEFPQAIPLAFLTASNRLLRSKNLCCCRMVYSTCFVGHICYPPSTGQAVSSVLHYCDRDDITNGERAVWHSLT